MNYNNLIKFTLIIGSFLISTTNNAQQIEDFQTFEMKNGTSYTYTEPKFFDMFRHVPKDIYEFGKYTVQKENLLWTSMAVGGTLALLPFDQKLLDNVQELGEPLGLAEDVSYTRLLGIEVLPKDINGTIYYIGNGLTPILLSGGFYIAGKINNDYRALNTSSELMEVLISSGVSTQIIKRITGRQSPSAAIESGNPGGHWTPFPSFKAYQTNTPNYDAMPSGHMTTYIATLTVIATNYPDVKWLKPVGYSVAGIMAFQMMSTRVHWASDYPFAILMGYVIGKNAANRRIKKEIKRDVTGEIIEPRFNTDFTFFSHSGYNMAGVVITF
ncbi:phosphatase PAP2 family protein [Algibacter lectus]|uniref:PAP2 superfamily protein n=1 Tax=Algibacter lectus TaxID=221126 RepID=A0A4R8M6I4_9FLAO|nr:phosphatase PAP2 family protein [Algibacter lectus]MWW26026.1 phosphatase PAP2 family protein [Algibacter lectus]TDY60754.1 PAP2 superfamily protein [Algibacter lectus]